MEDRPTTSTVKHMLEASGLEVGERLATALLPVWEAVRALQSGVKEAGGEMREMGAMLAQLRQAVVSRAMGGRREGGLEGRTLD